MLHLQLKPIPSQASTEKFYGVFKQRFSVQFLCIAQGMLLFCVLSLSHTLQAANRFYMDVQSGSSMGLAHVSVGMAFNERHHLMMGGGYVPESSDHEEMGLISLRYLYKSPYAWELGEHWSIMPLNVGIGVLYSLHDDLSFDTPSNTPDGYYGPTNTRLILNYQTVLRFNPQFEAYIDFSMIEMGIASYVRDPGFYNDNYGFLGLAGITNWGVGMRYYF